MVHRNPDIRNAQAYIRKTHALYTADGDTATIIKYLREAARLYQQANEPKTRLLLQVVRKFEAKNP
jgi:hypothetical protein